METRDEFVINPTVCTLHVNAEIIEHAYKSCSTFLQNIAFKPVLEKKRCLSLIQQLNMYCVAWWYCFTFRGSFFHETTSLPLKKHDLLFSQQQAELTKHFKRQKNKDGFTGKAGGNVATAS